MAIHFILSLSRQGKIRISKWFDNTVTHRETLKLAAQIHRLISSRDHRNQSNFVEFQSKKLVYRRYAGLYFIMCVDPADNELGCLEAIHLFVEVLDTFFSNVCELDLVFNYYKVYALLDEMFMSGEIEESSKEVLLSRIREMDKLE